MSAPTSVHRAALEQLGRALVAVLASAAERQVRPPDPSANRKAAPDDRERFRQTHVEQHSHNGATTWFPKVQADDE